MDFETFILMFPEFSEYSESLVNNLIEVSSLYFNENVWGDKLDFVRYLLVAHYLQLEDIFKANKSNTVNTIDVKDELTVKFNQVTIDENEYKNTYYGRVLYGLIKQKGYQFSTIVRPKGCLSGAV